MPASLYNKSLSSTFAIVHDFLEVLVNLGCAWTTAIAEQWGPCKLWRERENRKKFWDQLGFEPKTCS